MAEPLRIGILGAAHIAGKAVVRPAQAIGAELVAVAARDLDRAESYAGTHGIAKAYGSYDELLADPDVEVVYNPSPNSEHVRWTLAALRAGKHVLSEKPFASNADEVRRVAAEPNPAGLVIFEGFHHLYHPTFQRMLELAAGGAIGEITQLRASMRFNCANMNDIRWSWQLSGGSLMDLGCYTIHVGRDVAKAMGGELELRSASATTNPEADPRVDATATVEGLLPNGARVEMVSSLEGPLDTSVLVTGTRGTSLQPMLTDLAVDDRLIITVDGVETVERPGNASTYTYQLRALEAAVREGVPFPTGLEDAIVNMEFVDKAYRLAGFPLREAKSG